MEHDQRLRTHGRKGSVLVLSMLLLLLTASLAAALATGTSLELRKSDNLQQVHKARLAAESGMALMTHTLKNIELAPGVRDQDMLDALAVALQADMNGTGNLQGNQVTQYGSVVSVPSIALEDGSSFSASIYLDDASTVRLAVEGTCPGNAGVSISRTLMMEFNCGSKSPGLTYGVYSKGPITIEQNFDYQGANTPEEASMYTEASSGYAVSIGHNGYIDGDIDLKDPFGAVSLGMNTVVKGDVNVGVPPSPIPEVDPSVFIPFATNTMTGSTPTQNCTLTNLRIPAGMNPTFKNNVTLKGVIYIEAPNYVYFKNNVTVAGVIVTDDAGDVSGTSKIYFKNNLDISGVDTLPDTSEFRTLRTMTGSAILAPGFDLEFKNNFSTMSGTIACEQLLLKNNLDATIYGALIIYGDGGLTFKNNASITIDRSGLEGMPSGLAYSGVTIFLVNPDSYQELQ